MVKNWEGKSMFNWRKKKNNQPVIRDTLFGDLPIASWTGNNASSEPWTRFQSVENNLNLGETQLAIQELENITQTPNLESRHYVQAWHFLRQLGVMPSENQAKEVYGVVVEVSLKQGLDIVAAYADHSACYFNHSGAGVIWENLDDSLHDEITNLLNAGKNIIHQIGPWESERPGIPPEGQARVSMLTPSGLHFGQAPFEALANDGMGGPVIQAATNLMQALIQKSQESSAHPI
jgi:hypothetical protein